MRACSAALLLVAALLSGCNVRSDFGNFGNSNRIVMGISDNVVVTDPASGYDPGSWLVFNNVFQSLLSFQTGYSEPQPEAAKKCTFLTSRTTYRCTLRDNLTFSNGNALTSEDVKFSFDRTMKIDDPSGPAPLLSSIEDITTPDAMTIIFHLKAPDMAFPGKIASGGGSIVDHRTYSADSLQKSENVVGSGPYKLDSIDNSRAVFSVNSNYRGSARIKNSGIIIIFYRGDQRSLALALEKGDIDIAYRGLTAQDISQVSSSGTAREGGIEVVEGSSAEVQHLVFNMSDPLVGKIGVRKAIAYTINRYALINDIYRGTASPLYSIIPAGILAHNTAFFDMYGDGPQPEKAKRALLAEGLTEKVKVTLWSTPIRYGPSTDEEFEAIAKQLNDSDLFEASVRSVPFGRYEKGIAAGEYGIYVKGWVPDYPDPDNFTQPFFGEDNVLRNGYRNSDITDRILPKTASESDRAHTRKDFSELQDQVARDLPILPIWQGKQYAVAHGRISGLRLTLDPSTVFRFWELEKT
ncbi:ABC transporter substrate-binding protein [Streptomyces sp. NPDC056707]|uniref:ABC transporter substrate-binding protein n=1 Tax=Streptomyces sp. NPDC056707 TaxID=3345919 RepID=UPI0036B4E85F